MDQKKTRALTISPRLEDYLKRAEAGLANRTKTPSQHAAARRVRDMIRGHIRLKEQASEAAALSSRQPDPAIMMGKSEKNN
jgi:hypothetical protein